jgi:two-component system, chemotaxis family, sensor kinase CheA
MPRSSRMSSDLEKYRSLYFSEAQEQLAAIHASLDALGDAPTDRNELNAAFRAAHTLKAMSATMGFGELTRASHSLEDLLARMKNQNEVPTDLTLRLLRNATEDINVRLRRAETAAVIDAVEKSAHQEPATQILTSPLSTNVRVRQQDLNLLLELVAELAASSNVLEHSASQAHTPHADSAVRNQRELVRELRRLTWHLNMSPIGPVFDRYGRVLTELARQQNKTLRVVTQGVEVELCHAMIDELNEPLLHLLRNAITHGIELPAERTWAEKDSAGVVTLRAQRNGDRVIIQIGDDGRGMDAGAILQAAYSQGLVTREQRRSMNAKDALRLILIPNFSMSHTITPNAGRGIGMSVVQEKLNAVGGHVEIQSELGRGTIFTLDVPRVVGLLEVELVRTGARIYAIPTSEILSARIWLASEIAKRQKENVGGLNDWRILDVESLKPVTKAQLAAPAGMSLVELQEPQGVALRVDELLGKALLNYPFAVRAASIPILDPVALLQS